MGRRIAWIVLIAGCSAPPMPGDAGVGASCGRAPGPVCDGTCTSFPCGDPVCTPRCGTSCYECTFGTWYPVVTDCFCGRDANIPDVGPGLDAGHDAAIDAPSDAPDSGG